MELPGFRETVEVLSKNHPMMVSKQEAAQLLGISRETLRRHIVSGDINNKGKFISITEIARFLLRKN